MTRRICPRCGEPFTPFRSHFVLCFSCHLATVRERIQERHRVIERIVTNPAICKRNPSARTVVNQSHGQAPGQGGTRAIG